MKTPASRLKTAPYENNPFFVAVKGVELLFEKAKPIGIALIVLTGLMILNSLPSLLIQPDQEKPASTPAAEAEAQAFTDALSRVPLELWVLGGLLVLAAILIMVAVSIVIRGVLDYTSAALASGKNVTLTEAFRAVFERFWAYTWMLIILTVKVLLWSLLFIVPGIIMAVRYSLSGVAFFEKGLRGNAAVQHSSKLVKNAWLTTYASQTLLPLVTLGLVQSVVAPGTNAVLYRQLSKARETKPEAHALSWATLLLPLAFLLFLVLFALALAAILASQSVK